HAPVAERVRVGNPDHEGDQVGIGQDRQRGQAQHRERKRRGSGPRIAPARRHDSDRDVPEGRHGVTLGVPTPRQSSRVGRPAEAGLESIHEAQERVPVDPTLGGLGQGGELLEDPARDEEQQGALTIGDPGLLVAPVPHEVVVGLVLPLEVPPAELERHCEDRGGWRRGIRREELRDSRAGLLVDFLDGQRPLPKLDQEQLRRLVEEVLLEADGLLLENPLPAIAHGAPLLQPSSFACLASRGRGWCYDPIRVVTEPDSFEEAWRSLHRRRVMCLCLLLALVPLLLLTERCGRPRTSPGSAGCGSAGFSRSSGRPPGSTRSGARAASSGSPGPGGGGSSSPGGAFIAASSRAPGPTPRAEVAHQVLCEGQRGAVRLRPRALAARVSRSRFSSTRARSARPSPAPAVVQPPLIARSRASGGPSEGTAPPSPLPPSAPDGDPASGAPPPASGPPSGGAFPTPPSSTASICCWIQRAWVSTRASPPEPPQPCAFTVCQLTTPAMTSRPWPASRSPGPPESPAQMAGPTRR